MLGNVLFTSEFSRQWTIQGNFKTLNYTNKAFNWWGFKTISANAVFVFIFISCPKCN